MNSVLYQTIASKFVAIENCRKSDTINEWESRHAESIESLVRDHMPSGSGFDCGTKFDFDASRPDRLVFTTSFHHMDDSGSYDGWTDHSVIVTPSLASGFNLRITGRDKRLIKSYIGDVFHGALSVDVPHY